MAQRWLARHLAVHLKGISTYSYVVMMMSGAVDGSQPGQDLLYIPPKQHPKIRAMDGTADHGLLRMEFSKIKAAETVVSNLMSFETNHIDKWSYLLLSHWGGKLLSGS